MATMYDHKDAELTPILKAKKIAVIGYGSQGHAHAENLRDSGLDVIVANRPGSANYNLAVADGFEPVSAAEAAQIADVIVILVPYQAAAKVYVEEIEPHLSEGKVPRVTVSTCTSIKLFRLKNVDVVMVAPKSPGHLLRRMMSSVRRARLLPMDFSGEAKARALAYARGIGCTRAGVIETTFEQINENRPFR